MTRNTQKLLDVLNAGGEVRVVMGRSFRTGKQTAWSMLVDASGRTVKGIGETTIVGLMLEGQLAQVRGRTAADVATDTRKFGLPDFGRYVLAVS